MPRSARVAWLIAVVLTIRFAWRERLGLLLQTRQPDHPVVATGLHNLADL